MDNETQKLLNKVSKSYDFSGTVADFTEVDNGHINNTYRVRFISDQGAEEYIFQRINSYVFKDPVKVMENINEVTLHLKSKETETDCGIITFLNTKDGKNYTIVDYDYWRVCPYVKNSVTYESVENSRVLFSAGYAFGRFQELLSDLPMEKLHTTIPDFHNTTKRLESFFQTVACDPVGRAKELEAEIAFFEEYRELAIRVDTMLEKGELPLRVVHNDTKYNNILMHKDTDEPLCVVDLDTVMPGLSMHDFGDAIRFAANTAVEDEADLSQVGLNLEHYTEFTKGFMKACSASLTKNEIENMALGAIVITIELASRFLADHINGGKYFRIHRENHNLDRARCQIKLAQDMIAKYDKMFKIVKDCVFVGPSPK